MTNSNKRNSGRWTDARYRAFIISALRAASRRWPPKFQTLQEACVGQQINQKTNRISKHYKCATCSKTVPTSEIQIDHISPIVPPRTGFTTWDDFIERLFCEKDNLQALCKPCHLLKTKEEKDASKKRTRS